MNEMNYLMDMVFNSLINQAIINKEKHWQPLPQDQQDALNKILDAIHEISENKEKIHPQYRQQALEAIALRIASEMKNPIGG